MLHTIKWLMSLRSERSGSTFGFKVGSVAGLTLILVAGESPGSCNVSICDASRGFVVSLSGRQRRVESPSPLAESRPRTEVFFLQLPPSSKLRQSARRQRLVSEMPCTCSSHVLRKPARLKLNRETKICIWQNILPGSQKTYYFSSCSCFFIIAVCELIFLAYE